MAISCVYLWHQCTVNSVSEIILCKIILPIWTLAYLYYVTHNLPWTPSLFRGERGSNFRIGGCGPPNRCTPCIKKAPTFKLSQTLSNRNQFLKFLHYWKAYGICYKTPWHYPPHLGCVATLPWKIKNSNFLQIFSDNTRYGRKCKRIAYEVQRF